MKQCFLFKRKIGGITMEEIRNNKELEQLLNKAEELDWNYTIWNEPEGSYGGWHQNERNYVELETCSLLGEDFSMIIDFDKEETIDSFLENLKEYESDFDSEEHAKMWIESRGKNGVPNSIRDLLDDAEEIKKMIFELWDKLSEEIAIPQF